MEVGGFWLIIVANDADVFGHLQAPLLDSEQDTKRQLVVRCKNGCHVLGPTERNPYVIAALCRPIALEQDISLQAVRFQSYLPSLNPLSCIEPVCWT